MSILHSTFGKKSDFMLTNLACSRKENISNSSFEIYIDNHIKLELHVPKNSVRVLDHPNIKYFAVANVPSMKFCNSEKHVGRVFSVSKNLRPKF